LIDDSPTRSITRNPNGAIITGRRHFDADFFFFHFGPYAEFPITEKLKAVVSGGLAFGVMAGHFQFNERETVPSAGTSTRKRGEVDNVEALVGGFFSATLNYALDEKWSIFGGGQFQSLTGYEASANGRKVKLDLTTTPFLVTGVTYSF
jgi:hypothetical protein